MTLVLTEISRFGVVMAADTAETREATAQSGARYVRVTFGTPKLFPIPSLSGGVSFWGAGEIYAGSRSARIPTDIWLEDFVVREMLQNLEQFAYTLRKHISLVLGAESQALGFQVAGVRSAKAGEKAPILYRISNRDRKGGVRADFEVETEESFPHLDDKVSVFAEGDYALYDELQRRVGAGDPLRSKRGDSIPHPSLRGRAEYQAAWVRIVSDLYQSAGLSRTIGGKVTTVSVDYDQELHWTTS